MSLNLVKIIPPLPKVTRGKRCYLKADPKGIFLLYTNGNSVVIRHLKDVSKNDIYTLHSVAVHVAVYSPSGFYIASADKSGKVRIWDTVNAEHILKNEFQPFCGPIYDLAWSIDNEKIFVGGSGQSKFGAVFNADTGSSVGSIMGMSRNINTVDFSPMRPFRAVAGNDEGGLTFFEGTPFAFKHNEKKHSGFLNVVTYCPTGFCFVSGGADGKLFVYSGDTGLYFGEVGSPAHSGGIYGVAFSKDGARMVSVSADKSLKLWQVERLQITFLSEYKLADSIDNMILGCAWVGDTIAVVTLNSFISVFSAPPDVRALQKPSTVLTGHSKPITAGAFSREHSFLVTSSADATIAMWNMDTGVAEMITGTHGHTSQVQGLAMAGDLLITIGLDDRCVLTSLSSRKILASTALPSQPHSIGLYPSGMLVVVACEEHMALLDASAADRFALIDQLPFSLGTCKMAVSAKTGTAVVCCSSGKLLCFKNRTGKLVESCLVNGQTTDIVLATFSADGSTLALAAADRTITVYTFEDGPGSTDLPTLVKACPEWWQRQTARIMAMGWSPNGRRLASASLDTSVVVWSLDKPKDAIILRNAHPMSHSSSLSWLNDNTLVSTAHDGSIREWTVKDS